VTELAEELAGAGVEEMTRRLMAEASLGNGAAMRLYFDRIWPKRRGAPIKFEMPPVRSLADVPVAHAAICQGVADGELSVEEFEMLSRGVNHMKRSLDEAEIDARLERHEAMLQAMAKGIGATFDFAPTSWEVDEPDDERPDEVQFAAAEESQVTDVASATDLQEESVAPAADLQDDVASATNLQATPVAPATDLQASIASAMNLQSGADAGSPDGAQRHPGRPTPDFGAARLNPGYEAGSAAPLAPATNLQDAPVASTQSTAPLDRKANGHDEAWMHDFVGPENAAPSTTALI